MNRLRQPQRGVVLLGLMLILIIGIGFLLLQGRRGPTRIEREAQTITALTAAREALIARAIGDANRPGSLPCPDLDVDGIADLAYPKCDTYSGSAYIGWLPWRTLDINDPRDASSESLWYVLSPNFNDGNTAINSDTPGTLSLDGQGDIVALIIAPGGSLTGQSRPSLKIADYLDNVDGNPAASNHDNDGAYFSGPADSQFNDRLIALDRNTLMNAVAPRILGEIRYAVAAAGLTGKPLPEVDTDGDGKPGPEPEADTSNPDGENKTQFFPYLDEAYAEIPSPTWIPEKKDDPPHKWHESLANNRWFAQITYDRAKRSVSLYGHTVILP
ncbi:MAG: hypothetical protein LBE62_12555 [Azonexus sp.]|jgi:hypothetical protein|nr:hypothetical protein [Azonexus sp.]